MPDSTQTNAPESFAARLKKLHEDLNKCKERLKNKCFLRNSFLSLSDKIAFVP